MEGKDRLTIADWAEEDRPREKMMAQGASALSNAELLAILIGSGSTDCSAVELMRNILLNNDNSLDRLGRLSVAELCEFKGIGPAKAVTILAACELGRRRAVELPQRVRIRSSDKVYDYLYALMRDLPTEVCYVLLLNQSSYVIDAIKIGSGGLTETSVDIRVILREALLKRATHLILCHNHPSGNTRPSMQDDKLTHQLAQAAKVMNIGLTDHVIFTDNGYYSYADEGKL